MAFLLSEAEDGTIAVAILTPEGRLRVGIYTIKHVGGGLLDFLRFDSLAQATARTLGLEDVEILGLEITCPRLQAVLERGGFHATTMPVPEELGGGIFQAISRIQAIV